jgi:uncharacterized membrane protein YqjE
MQSDATGRPSTPSLVADAIAQLGRLVETEIRLVRTELSEKVADAVRAVVLLVVSAVLLVAALILILQGLVYLLIYFGLQPFVAAFIVGIAIAIIAGIVVWIALRALSADNLKPKRAISQISRDATVIKDQVS